MSPVPQVVSGELLVVAVADAVLVLAGADEAGAVLAWELLGGGGSAADVLHLLTARSTSGFAGVPDFALVTASTDGAHVVVRGRLEVRGARAGVPVVVDGTGVSTWTEQLLDVVHQVHAPGAALDARGLPLVSGVTRGGGVLVAGADGAVVEEQRVTVEPVVEEPVVVAPVIPLRAAAEPATVDGAEPEPVVVRSPEVTLLPDEPLVDAVPRSVPATAAAGTDYRDLWEATIARSAEDAAVRTVEEEPAVAPPPAPEGDHDGHTLLKGDLAAVLTGPAGPTPGQPPLVLTRSCPEGHGNPPHAGTCRVCGAGLTADSAPAVRPSLGRLRVSTGQVVELHRPVVIGRSPSSSRVQAQDLPQLVAVVAPANDVSGSHLSVQLDGWSVLVTDLHSTNWSTLHRPGRAPQRMTGGEPVLVVSGDVVEIGAGIDVTFEDVP